MGERANIWFGAVLRADQRLPIRIGARSSIQDNVVIHTSSHRGTLVGDDVTVGHAAVLEGCEIGNRSLIGMKACVLDNAKVGEGTLIAAGSVVGEGAVISAGVLAAGVPAREKKPLEGRALEHLEEAVEHYQTLMDLYAHLREGPA